MLGVVGGLGSGVSVIRGEGMGREGECAASGATNLYGPLAVDSRRVEAWVEGCGEYSVAVGEHAATGLD